MTSVSTSSDGTRLVYTVKEAAEELRIGYSTARERIASGQLRSFKVGRRRLVARDDLVDYIESMREAASG